MSNVTQLDEYQKHFTIPTTDGNVHVIPDSLLLDVIKGKQPPNVLGDEVLKKIILEWREVFYL